MDPDIEFNALSALTQSVVQDMKASYPAWDMVAQRATKLSQQLKVTVQCFTAFVDSLQAVSDLGNNLKGASRDLGACVTRVCMRERALDSRIRAVADSLQDQLAQGIQQRSSFWKQRTNELDKAAAKHIKKVRSRKGRPDATVLHEQRQLCADILSEQRSQFSFFVGALMPFLTAEVGALDEGPNIRQVVDTLDDTIRCVDGPALIQQIVGDIGQGVDNAWKQCLATAGRKFGSTPGPSTRSATPCYYNDDVTPQEMNSFTISSNVSKPYSSLSTNTFIAPSKPPLQRRASGRSTFSVTPSEPCCSPPSQLSNLDISGRVQRPQSFTGELRHLYQAPTVDANRSFMGASTSCSSSDMSAALIAETQHLIDQLGSDLENYCLSSESKNLDQTQSCNTSTCSASNVRIRSGPTSRPPPPTRRSSTITAATPSAPSVAEARLNSSSIMGSRLSLNNGSTSGDDRYPVNVNPYSRQYSAPPPNFHL